MKQLKDLCLLCGPSGDEGTVREYIKERVQKFADKVTIDSLGNVIVFKKGKKRSDERILLCAHMDEVGFIIKEIDDDGYLRFDTVGGIDPKVLVSRRVTIGNGTPGIIGIKAVHLQKKEERDSAPKIEDMYIDIGAKSADEAKQVVTLGDYGTFYGEFTEFGDSLICSKALDDRAGVSILLSIIETELEKDTYFAFTVQEEVGLRGASVIASSLKPDIVLVAETTTAADFTGVESKDVMTKVGDGVALSIMDRRTIYDRGLFNLAKDTAVKLNIPFQIKKGTAGGNDSGALQRDGGGARVIVLSIPCRYIHSQNSVISKKDYESAKRLALAITRSL